MSYTDSNKDGVITPDEIIEENHYYPFGLKHKGYNTIVNPKGNSLAQKYKFGAKELDENFGLNTYNFGARSYVPDLGRWMNVDPISGEVFKR